MAVSIAAIYLIFLLSLLMHQSKHGSFSPILSAINSQTRHNSKQINMYICYSVFGGYQRSSRGSSRVTETNIESLFGKEPNRRVAGRATFSVTGLRADTGELSPAAEAKKQD